MGKLLPGVGGMDAPQYGRIAPLTSDDVGTVEMSKPALRCLRQTMPAAALLHSCARPSAPNAKLLTDLVPGVLVFVCTQALMVVAIFASWKSGVLRHARLHP